VFFEWRLSLIQALHSVEKGTQVARADFRFVNGRCRNW